MGGTQGDTYIGTTLQDHYIASYANCSYKEREKYLWLSLLVDLKSFGKAMG